jgi:hypothetical protein
LTSFRPGQLRDVIEHRVGNTIRLLIMACLYPRSLRLKFNDVEKQDLNETVPQLFLWLGSVGVR